jgi:hypothetical protein
MGYLFRQAARAAARLIRCVAATVADMHYAGRRMTELMISPDCYLTDADVPPDTYQEFLFRTSGSLIHEGSARSRMR